MVNLVSAIKLDENLTLQAACLDEYGNTCADAVRWTVLYPDGSVLYDNLEGGNTTDAIRNITLWFNTTGAWFALANFSERNVTREYLMVVEDYTTLAQKEVLEESNLISVLIFLGLLVFSFIYLGMRMDEKHSALRWGLILLAFMTGMFGFGYASLSQEGGDVSKLLTTGYYFSTVFLGLIGLYVLYYVLVSIKEMMLSSMQAKKEKKEKNG